MATKARAPGQIARTAGRSTQRFRRLANELRTTAKARRLPCCICGQPIDYDLPHPDPASFSVEHIKPRSTHPHLAEDPSNFGPAHLGCNSAKGNGYRPGLGETSTSW